MQSVITLFLTLCIAITLACTRIITSDNTNPGNEICLIKSESTCVVAIDGNKVPYSGGGFAKFKVTPGEHTITVGLYDQSNYPYIRTSKSDSIIKFLGTSGHKYITRPQYIGNQWKAELVDDETKAVVSY